jgi:hypothetical protein
MRTCEPGVHAHSGKRRLYGDVERNQQPGAQTGKFVNTRIVGHMKNHCHQQESDRHLRDKRNQHAAGAGRCDDIIHCGIRHPRQQSAGAEKGSGGCAGELRAYIEEGINRRNFAEPVKRQRRAWIEVSTRLFPQGE